MIDLKSMFRRMSLVLKSWLPRLAVVAVFLLAQRATMARAADDAGVEFSLEIRACAEGGATLVKGGACWIMDPARGQSVVEYTVCAGLTIQGGVLLVGGEGSLMVCGTMRVPADLAANGAAMRAAAALKLADQLREPETRRAVERSLGAYSSVRSATIQAPDPRTEADVKRAIRAAQPK